MRNNPNYQKHPRTKLPTIDGARPMSQLEGKELKFFMSEYTHKAKSINIVTHLAMLDILNDMNLGFGGELFKWQMLSDNNPDTMKHLMRYDFYHMIEINRSYVIRALIDVEKLFRMKFPTAKPLEELLPQWYDNN